VHEISETFGNIKTNISCITTTEQSQQLV